ncbi:hypothetical protein Emag_007853 [Eimeria magna]
MGDAVWTTLLARGNMDMEYSYAVSPYRVESLSRVTEDYSRRWQAFELVAREEERALRDQGDEPDPPSPVVSSPTTPSTSVGGSPPGGSSPLVPPEVLEPLERPRRRRRLESPPAPSPAASESVEEVQPPSAPANNDSAGADAESSAEAPHSTSH